MTEILGFMGGISFGVCMLPQIIKAYKTKSTRDVSWWMMALNYMGNLFMLSYVILDGKMNWVFGFDYIGAITLCLVLTILKLIYDRR